MALWHIDCKSHQQLVFYFLIFFINIIFLLSFLSCIVKVCIFDFSKSVFLFIFQHYFMSTAYDKLAMYGLRIHGCIDEASHYVLYAKVASNKTQETIFEPFRRAMEKFGAPLRVRSDFAVEHVLICRLMEEAQIDIRNLFLVGSSVHNQVRSFFLSFYVDMIHQVNYFNT